MKLIHKIKHYIKCFKLKITSQNVIKNRLGWNVISFAGVEIDKTL